MAQGRKLNESEAVNITEILTRMRMKMRMSREKGWIDGVYVKRKR